MKYHPLQSNKSPEQDLVCVASVSVSCVLVTVRDKKIDVRVCLIVGINKCVGYSVDSKPKWLGFVRNPEVRSPMENRRVISYVPGLHSVSRSSRGNLAYIKSASGGKKSGSGGKKSVSGGNK